ncbi:MAG: hypothetical protein ACK5P7_03130, partial [Bdellovibrio sp.]
MLQILSWLSPVALGAAFLFFDFSMAFAQGFPQVRVTATSLRVRNLDGVHVCSLPAGTRVQPIGRDSESEKIQIRPGTRNCPETGIVDADYVDFGDDVDAEVQVIRQGTNFRSRASLDQRTVECQLPAGSRLNLESDEPISNRVSFYKVSMANPPAGCPKTGFVAASLLEPSDPFERLPEYRPTDPRRSTVAQACTDCDERSDDAVTDARNIRRALKVGDEQKQIAKALTRAAQGGVGHVGRNLCYRAVKRIIGAARVNGQRIADVSKLQGGSAADAMSELPRAGFTNMLPAGCTIPGAILVYEGAAHQFLASYKRAGGRQAKASVKAQARRFMLQRFGKRYMEG